MFLNSYALLAALLVASSAFATTEERINVSRELTPEQAAQVQVYANQLLAKTPAPEIIPAPDKTAEQVKEWASIGTAIGTGLVSAAKELGVAANDFATTPVGKFTVFLIAWHFMGGQLLHLVIGFIWIAVTLPITLYLFRTMVFDTKIEEYEKDKGPGGKTRVTTRTRRHVERGEITPFCFPVCFGSAVVALFFLILVTF